MSSAVFNVERRTSEVEVVAVRVAGVDAEVPEASRPVYGPVEISGVTERAVLPVEEDVAQVEVAVAPVCAIEVVYRVDSQQIV